MKKSDLFEHIKWPLLLVLAAAGLWFFGDRLYNWNPVPERAYTAEGVSLSILADSNRVRVEGLSPEALRYLRERSPDLSGVVEVYALPAGQEWSDSLLPSDGTWQATREGIEFTARHDWLAETSYHVRVDRSRLNELLNRESGGGMSGATEAEGTTSAAGTTRATGSTGTTRSAIGTRTAGAGTVDTSFVISRPADLEPERVTGVYPSADTLPQNLLKFYIHFSGTMSRGGVYEHIRIRDEEGEVVPDAFLELPQELWDPETTRLTILFDPGRIKRGLERHNLMGVAFEPGRRYTLVVDRTLRDGNGLPIGRQYRKEFTVSEPDREMPDHEQWRIETPSAGTREELVMYLDEPMDHALLRRLISVHREDGNDGSAGGAGGISAEAGGDPAEAVGAGEDEPIAGSVEIRDGERVWAFRPERPWREGSYRMEIERVIEDLAGNNLNSVFDVELQERAGAGAPDEAPGDSASDGQRSLKEIPRAGGADDPVNPSEPRVPTAEMEENSGSDSLVVKYFKIGGT